MAACMEWAPLSHPTAPLTRYCILLQKRHNIEKGCCEWLLLSIGSMPAVDDPSACMHCVWQGSWSRDMKQGLGRKLFSNGDVYEGLWRENRFHGPGRYRWRNRDEYDGEWNMGMMQGRGTLRWKTGLPSNVQCCETCSNATVAQLHMLPAAAAGLCETEQDAQLGCMQVTATTASLQMAMRTGWASSLGATGQPTTASGRWASSMVWASIGLLLWRLTASRSLPLTPQNTAAPQSSSPHRASPESPQSSGRAQIPVSHQRALDSALPMMGAATFVCPHCQDVF